MLDRRVLKRAALAPFRWRALSAAALAVLIGGSGAAAKTLFEDLDQNGDGTLDFEEVLAGKPDFTGPIFIFSDQDNDGKLTKHEFVRAQRRALQDELTD